MAEDGSGVRPTAATDPPLVTSSGAVGETVSLTGTNVAGRDLHIDTQHVHVAAPAQLTTTNLYQLPPDVDDFTGREADLKEIHSLLGRRPGKRATTVVVSAIAGKAGVGKTALAIRAAHQLRKRFPEGQLYVNLRGAEPHQLDPNQVLSDFLRALGVDGSVIPEAIEERAKLYRERLQDRSILVVLDNAAGPEQVRHLLPVSPANGVIVTSRSPLATLGGVHLLQLDVLEVNQALELLAKMIGQRRVAAEPDAAKAIVQHCSYLPLAVRIAGARLAERPNLRLQRLAERLADERQVLSSLKAADLEVRACFAISYDARTDDERRAFRMLGLLYAPDFTIWRTAALLDCSTLEAEDLMAALATAQLIDETGEDLVAQQRFRFHDLLRVFALERAEKEESIEARRAALERVGSGFLGLAELAADRLEPGPLRSVGKGTSVDWRVHDEPLIESIGREPLVWFVVERTSLVIAIERAHSLQVWDRCWQLAECLPGFFDFHSHWDDWQRTHELALDAARSAGNPHGQGATLRHLGRLQRYMGRWQDADRSLQESVKIFRQIPDAQGEARTLVDVVRLYWYLGRRDDAIAAFTRGRSLFREVRDSHGEARILNSVGLIYLDTGRWQEARASFEAALATFRSTGDRRWTAASLWGLGDAYRYLGLWEEAESSLKEALPLLRGLGNRWWEAVTLCSLCDVYRDLDRWTEAKECVDTGLVILEELGNVYWKTLLAVRLGDVYRAEGRQEAAIACLENCLVNFRQLGDRRWEAITQLGLGNVYQSQGRWQEGAAVVTSALAVFRQLQDRSWEAKAHRSLGEIHAATGSSAEARQYWRRALSLFEELNSWEAAGVATLLEEQPRPSP